MDKYQERAYERSLKKMNNSQLQKRMERVQEQLTINLLAHNRKWAKTKRQEKQLIEERIAKNRK